MIPKLANKISEWLLYENKLDNKEDGAKEIYQYGLEIIISSLVTFLIVLGIGVILNMGMESIIFLMCFVPLRMAAGGYHANTYLKCNIYFSTLTFGIFLLYRVTITYLGEYVLFLLWSCSLVYMMIVAPVENENKKLTKELKKVAWKRVVIAMIIEGICLYVS